MPRQEVLIVIKISKILYPTDLSEYALYALPYATELAVTHKARLCLLYVVDNYLIGAPGAGFAGQPDDLLHRVKESGISNLNHLVSRIKEVEAESAVLIGTPHVEIVRYAREQEVDLIVLATHGRKGIAHALIGSVAEKVVQMAPCPVLTIKHPEHEFVMP